MIINRVFIFKSPFDSNYTNVPDLHDFDGDTETFIRRIRNKFLVEYDYKEYPTSSIKANAFKGEDVENITLQISDTFNVDDYKFYNYSIIEGDNGEMFAYFIKDMVILNAFDKPSITFNLNKDLWVHNWIKLRDNSHIHVVREHQKLLDSIGNFTEDYRAISEKTCDQLATVVPEKDYKILWVRYRVNPQTDIYGKYTTETEYEKLYPEIANEYGHLGYLYLPFLCYSGLDVVAYKFIIHAGETIYFYDLPTIGTPEVEDILSYDFTFNPPFGYEFFGEIIDGQVSVFITQGWSCTYVAFKYGSNYRQMFDEDIPFIAKSGLVPLESQRYKYTIEYPTDIIFTPSNENAKNSVYFSLPNLTLYVLILPDGQALPLLGNSPIKDVEVEIMPTDSGGAYRLYINGHSKFERPLFSQNASLKTFENDNQFIRTLDATETYLRTNGYKHRLGVVMPLTDSAVKGRHQTQSGVLDAIMGYYNQDYGQMAGGIQQVQFAFEDIAHSAVKTIMTHKATMNDLQNQTIAYGTVSNASNDRWIVDRPILLKMSPRGGRDAREVVYDCLSKGVVTDGERNPFINACETFDYISGYEFYCPSFSNEQYKAFFSRLFERGVRKWHINSEYFNPLLEIETENYWRY